MRCRQASRQLLLCRSGALRGAAQPLKRTAMRHSHDSKPEVEDLDRLSRAELRALWAQELGDKPPASLGRDVLALAIAYARQERLYGGLTKPVANELDRLLGRALRDGRTNGTAAPTIPAAAAIASMAPMAAGCAPARTRRSVIAIRT